MGSDLPRRLRTVQVRRSLRGYDVGQVDDWLEQLAKRSEGAGTDNGLGDPVRRPVFRMALGGYDVKVVDALVASALLELDDASPGTAEDRRDARLRSDLSQRLRTAEFRLSLRGYDVDQVDRWLELLAKRSEGSSTEDGLGDPVRPPTFTLSLRGYDAKEVDALVESAIKELNEGALGIS